MTFAFARSFARRTLTFAMTFMLATFFPRTLPFTFTMAIALARAITLAGFSLSHGLSQEVR